MTKITSLLMAGALVLAIGSAHAQPPVCNVSDSLALIDLYNADIDPATDLGWDFSLPVYNWYGVMLSSASSTRARVISLFLGGTMTGTLPASFGNLTALTNLTLRFNMQGPFPAALASLTGLVSIDLADNQLSGPLPGFIGNLLSLQSLSLQQNFITGPVPESLGDLPNLTSLLLYGNAINFDGFETLAQKKPSLGMYLNHQAYLPIHKHNGQLSVTAGGTLSNNTYIWTNSATRTTTTVIGDSTLTPAETGSYTVVVKNAVIDPWTNGLLRLESTVLDVQKLNIFRINPNPSFLDGSGAVLTNTSFPQQNRINGAVTDGVTKILLTTQSTVPVTFSLDDDKDGSLSSLQAQFTRSGTITIQPVAGNQVTVIYNAPDGYGENDPTTGRTISVHAVSTQDDESSVPLLLFSPPVVLVHGMWSGPSVWTDGDFMPYLKGGGIRVIARADYATYSTATFSPADKESVYGTTAVRSAILQSMQEYARDSIAVTQADVVAHSLGGLMTRSFSQQNDFTGLSNYYKGSIHKLITIGTPHRGAPIGAVLWNARDKFVSFHYKDDSVTIPVPLSVVMQLANHPIGTCHRDFDIGSGGILALSETKHYKVYAVMADYFPTRVPDYLAIDALTKTILNIPLDSIYVSRCSATQILPSDVIVARSSQQGYINSDTLFSGTTHSTIIPLLALTETNNPSLKNKVRQLLLTDDTTKFSSGFPAPSQQPLDCNTVRSFPPSAITGANSLAYAFKSSRFTALADGKYVAITSPASGNRFGQASGTPITLSFEARNGMQPVSSVFIVEDIGIFPVDNHSFTTSFTLPANAALGAKNIILLSREADGMIYADSVHLSVDASGVLDSLTISPAPVMLDSSIRSVRVTVNGLFINAGDTAWEDVTNASAGTTYSSQRNGAIFKVSANGLLTALIPGTDTLIVVNSGHAVKVAVIVSPNYSTATLNSNDIDFPPIADQLTGAPPIVLTAVATSGGPVGYNLVSGPAVVSNGIVTVTGIGTVTIRANAAGNEYFSAASPVTQSFNVTTTLPVTLTNFEAKRTSDSYVQLTWQTLSEQNNKGFIIERRLDNTSSFSPVAFAPTKAPNGNSNALTNYTFSDTNRYSGTTYYRLHQQDLDNSGSYSETKAVGPWGALEPSITIWPNPGQGWFNLQVEGIATKTNALITDASGRVIKRIPITVGQQVLVTGLPPGTYFISVNKMKKKAVVLND
jgi:pimeloyl-ACP methyl ester carboxylesterase